MALTKERQEELEQLHIGAMNVSLSEYGWRRLAELEIRKEK